MKRTYIVVSLILLSAAILFASPNLLIDGAETVVVDPPQEIVVTADFSTPGEAMTFRLYIDANGNRIPELNELEQYLKIIDGVPPIGWLSEDHIRGDIDSTINGEMTYGKIIDMDPPLTPVPIDTIYFYLVAKDDGDGSADTAIMKVIPPEADIEPEIPYVYGTIYDAEDSAAVVYPAFCVVAETDIEPVVNDSTGRFAISVPERDSTYLIQVIPLDGDHVLSNAFVTVGSSEDSVRHDFTCETRHQHIRGRITLDGGTPVPGFFIILAMNLSTYDVATTLHDPATGEFQVPAVPGSTVVGFIDYKNFPAGYFPYPKERRVEVPDSGDLTGVNFDLQPLDAAISGTVIDSSIHGDAETEGLWIYADGGDFGEFTARSDEEGNFMIPVKGTSEETYSITLETYGYDVYPWEYDSITVGEGDTVDGYNFILGEAWIDNEVAGIVTDIDAQPVESSMVIICNNELAFKKAWQMEYTDSIGGYSFDNLPAWEGSWFVGAYKESLGVQDPRMIVIETMTDDTVISDADFVFSLSGIEEKPAQRCGDFTIGEVFPNPFNATTRVEINVPENVSEIEITIYDIIGRHRKTLYNGHLSKGQHIITINDNNLPSGIYYLRAKSSDVTRSKKLILLK